MKKESYYTGGVKTYSTGKIALGIAVAFAAISQPVNAQTEAQRIADLERKLQNALTTIDKLANQG